MANQQEIQDLIDKTDIVSLVSRYVKLEKQGKNYRGLCPFHSEDTPSFLVSPEKNIAYCFGCHKGGNPLNFLMEIEHIDFKEGVSRLAEMNGVKLSSFNSTPVNNYLSKYHKVLRTSVDFYKKNLELTSQGKEAKNYLYKRGITDEIIKDFEIGLAPKPGNTLYQVLTESGYLELDMTDVGLVDKNEKGYYDLFSSRIMFPIFDEMGNPIGFSARIYEDSQKGQPKYINSRDTVLYKKDLSFFNLNNAKQEIMRKKRVILHEGQMDVIAAYKSGFKEAICSLGTGLSVKKASIILKHTNNVIICFDGDKAGVNASLSAIKIFKSQGFNVHLVLLPDGMDPDEYVMKFGPEKYKEYFEANIIDANQYIFKTALLNKNLNDATVVDSVKNEVFSMVMNISSTERENYLRALAQSLNTSVFAVSQDYDNYYNSYGGTDYVDNQYNPFQNEAVYVEPKKLNEIKSNCELRLFMYAKSSREKALYIDRMLNDRMEALSAENQRLWITLVNCFYENYSEFNEAAYIKMLSADDVRVYIENNERLKTDKNKYSDEDLNDCLEKLSIVKLDKENEKLSKKLNETSDINNQAAIITNRFANKRKQEQLKKNRRT